MSIAWENYRTVPVPVVAEPDWYVDQYTLPPPDGHRFPSDLAISLPRVVYGNNNVPATGLLLYVGATKADGVVLAPSGSLEVQVLEVVPGPNGPLLHEVEASLAIDLGVPTDLGVEHTGDYVVRAVSSTGTPGDTAALFLLRKVV